MPRSRRSKRTDQNASIRRQAIPRSADARATRGGPLLLLFYRKAIPTLCPALLSRGMRAQKPPVLQSSPGRRANVVPPSVIPLPTRDGTPRYRANLVFDECDV